MQVQSIQANQTTNNCRKPCFKAYFVNDAKGYFNNLWYHSPKTAEAKAEISAFTNNHKNHKLEIVNIEKDNEDYLYYHIFNHHTGKFTVYNKRKNESITEVLYKILKKLNGKEEDFFEDYKHYNMSSAYRALTGQD